MIKNYVLDTNVLLQNPNALFAFEEHNVILPEIVIEELDNFKKGHNEINVNAREVARKLCALRQKAEKSLFEGVKLDSGGMLYIKNPFKQGESFIPKGWEDKKRDNDILNTCLTIQQNTDSSVILVTQDIYLGIKADYLQIKNEQFRTDSVKNIDEQYKGYIDLCVYEEDFEEFIKNKKLDISKAFLIEGENEYKEVYDFEKHPNEFVILHCANNYLKKTILGKISKDKKNILRLQYENAHPFGITPKNTMQYFMQEALMAPVKDIPLVLIKGPAGTAKTFFTMAIILERLYEGNNPDNFRKALICRPNQLMEDDLGYLPGTEQEKIDPLMRAIFDAMEILVDSNKEERYKNEKELQGKINDVLDRNIIDMQAIGYLRGRSVTASILFADEIQNSSPNTAKSIITRAGEGTKIIMCGDPNQIDNQYLDSRTNGISYAIEKMKDSPLCAVITTSEKDASRSELVKDANMRFNRKD